MTDEELVAYLATMRGACGIPAALSAVLRFSLPHSRRITLSLELASRRYGHFHRFELKALLLGPASQLPIRALAHLLGVRLLCLLHIGHAVAHEEVDDPRQLVRRSGDRLRRPQPRPVPSEVGPEVALAPATAIT